MPWKAIIPPPIKIPVLVNAIETALDEVAALVEKDFRDFTATWNNKPAIQTEKKSGYRKIFGDDKVLFYVNEGTKPHTIQPVTASKLAFQGNYQAKTISGQIKSRSGGASGDFVFAGSVQHPGTEARNVDETIVKERSPDAKKIIQAGILKGSEKSGLR